MLAVILAIVGAIAAVQILLWLGVVLLLVGLVKNFARSLGRWRRGAPSVLVTVAVEP